MTMSFGNERPELKKLQEILDSAEVLETAPDDVITLDSVAVLCSALRCDRRVYSPVLPALADYRKHRISILSPLGMSMLGRRVGETFEVKTPGGRRMVSIDKILYQSDRSERNHSRHCQKRIRHGKANLRTARPS
jgi:regulator of nucleoside diphosphate kinase